MSSAETGAHPTNADPPSSGAPLQSDEPLSGPGGSSESPDMRRELAATAKDIDRAIAQVFDRYLHTPAVGETADSAALLNAMRYSLDAGGKRLRPALVLWSCEACGGSIAGAMPAAVAIEFVHTFSLIHDDLPALDNDDLRRGRPTNHRVFGEATAILAGDGLLALAFETIARDACDARLAVEQVAELACATGAAGMIGGEALDLKGERQPPSEPLSTTISRMKTARLIESACRLGAIAARASTAQRDALSRYGRALGMAFQIADDLLDASGDGERLGKRVQKDADAGKQTLVRAVGMEAARDAARRFAGEASAAAVELGAGGARLAALADYVICRDS